MPKWLKILLILAAVGIVGLGAIVGAIVWWVSANKDRLAADMKSAQTEGEAFGRTHAKNDCIEDSLAHLDACGSFGMVCETALKMRLISCFQVAENDATCNSVPKPTEILTTATWANRECAKHGRRGSQPCGRLMQTVVQACAQP